MTANYELAPVTRHPLSACDSIGVSDGGDNLSTLPPSRRAEGVTEGVSDIGDRYPGVIVAPPRRGRQSGDNPPGDAVTLTFRPVCTPLSSSRPPQSAGGRRRRVHFPPWTSERTSERGPDWPRNAARSGAVMESQEVLA